jgi:hypothetical protein
MIASYPVELESEPQDVWVVVTHETAYRPADRHGPAEGGEFEWHFSRTEYGDVDWTIQPTAFEVRLIEENMESDVSRFYD